jgi:hypothetical protein
VTLLSLFNYKKSVRRKEAGERGRERERGKGERRIERREEERRGREEGEGRNYKGSSYVSHWNHFYPCSNIKNY